LVLLAFLLLSPSFVSPVEAKSGVVAFWSVDYHHCGSPDVVSLSEVQRQGGADGMCLRFTYNLTGGPFDFCQVRIGVNGGVEEQQQYISCSNYSVAARAGYRYVFKIQGCDSGFFGTDCTAWWEKDFQVAPAPVPAPRPSAPPPAPPPAGPPTTQPTSSRLPIGYLPSRVRSTPVPLFGLAAPSAVLGVRTILGCAQSFSVNDSAKADCLANVRAGKVLVSWRWNRNPCAAQNCYGADNYVLSVPGGSTFTFDAGIREAWIPAPSDPLGCVGVLALHSTPQMSAATEACPNTGLPKGKLKLPG